MKVNLGIAACIAVGASVVGAGAVDAVPSLYGSESTRDLTISVLSQCSALHTLGDPITQYGAGSSSGEIALEIIGSHATQLVAPMSRPMGTGVCSVGSSSRAGAEGMVIALDAVSIVVNRNTIGAEGIDYSGSAGDPQNQWREVLRLVYTGMPSSAGFNIFARDCNSAARKAIVNNWDNVFHGTVTSCTDSHPSVQGTGANGYDQSNTIVEPGIRHAFRRDDAAGATDIFLQQLSLPGINFAQPAPGGSSAAQAAVYRALANSSFCNVKRPEDDWPPNTMPANPTLGYNATQIPEMSNVGVPASAGTGLGFTTQEIGSTNPSNLSPYLSEYSDQDPIRRKCVGRGNNANANLPMEQVCGANGTLGVVLPISVPDQLTPDQAYPTLACDPTLAWRFGLAPERPNGGSVRCPNGDVTQDFKCLLPVRADASQPGGIAFDCINPPGNVPQALFDTDGNGSIFPDAPDTDARPDVDGRVYNLILRRPDSTIRTERRPDPARPGFVNISVVGAFYRIHSTRSLLVPPPADLTDTCTQSGTDDQLGCLTTASPCSIGFAGRGAVNNNPGASLALVNGIAPTKATLQALFLGGSTYPFAHKVYLNTLQGFDILHNSTLAPVFPSTTPGTGNAEEELAKCFGSLLFDGTINIESVTLGFAKLPPATGSSTERPLCEDFNGTAKCGDATNSDACVGNDTVSTLGGFVPTSLCDNGLMDGDETGPDVCPAVRATCNTTTHHCQ